MWIEFREVEFACEQEDHGTDRGEPAVAARLALGGVLIIKAEADLPHIHFMFNSVHHFGSFR